MKASFEHRSKLAFYLLRSVIKIIGHQKIHAFSVCLGAVRLAVALQETVVDGVGSLLGRLLQFAGELIPVGVVGVQVGFHPPIQLASDGPVGLRVGG